MKTKKFSRDEVIKLYNEGLNGKEIAKKLGAGNTTIYTILKECGYQPKQLLKSGERQGIRLFDNKVEQEILDMYNNDVSPAILCKKFNCNYRTILKIVRRNGGTVKKRGGPKRVLSEGEIKDIIGRWKAGESQNQIAKSYKTNQARISMLIRKAGLITPQTHNKKELNGNWKGGKINSEGYKLMCIDANHKFFSMMNSSGYVMEHRLVMAEYLDRPLHPWETVHHKDGDKLNNIITNLQLCIGKHGNGVSYKCSECGSCRLEPVEL